MYLLFGCVEGQVADIEGGGIFESVFFLFVGLLLCLLIAVLALLVL